jgi:hypothetical protein
MSSLCLYGRILSLVSPGRARQLRATFVDWRRIFENEDTAAFHTLRFATPEEILQGRARACRPV